MFAALVTEIRICLDDLMMTVAACRSFAYSEGSSRAAISRTAGQGAHLLVRSSAIFGYLIETHKIIPRVYYSGLLLKLTFERDSRNWLGSLFFLLAAYC